VEVTRGSTTPDREDVTAAQLLLDDRTATWRTDMDGTEARTD